MPRTIQPEEIGLYTATCIGEALGDKSAGHSFSTYRDLGEVAFTLIGEKHWKYPAMQIAQIELRKRACSKRGNAVLWPEYEKGTIEETGVPAEYGQRCLHVRGRVVKLRPDIVETLNYPAKLAAATARARATTY